MTRRGRVFNMRASGHYAISVIIPVLLLTQNLDHHMVATTLTDQSATSPNSNPDSSDAKQIRDQPLPVANETLEPTHDDLGSPKINPSHEGLTTTTTTTTTTLIGEKGPETTPPSPPPTQTTTDAIIADVTKEPIECPDTKYCFNGGKCILNEYGHPHCICVQGFHGNRCQIKDFCKSVIIEALTGDQICAKLNSDCIRSDKFLRCSCHEDEYFIFKILQDIHPNHQQQQQLLNQARQGQSITSTGGSDATTTNKGSNLKRSKSLERLTDSLGQHTDSATFAYDINEDNLSPSGASSQDSNHKKRNPTYLAECRKIDKCLGLRCRQLSEVCLDGQCVCNQDAGYVSDPTDGGLCKLLDPCSMPQPQGVAPICGQAQCVATFNRDLYRCLCPVGHILVKIDDNKNSSVCAPLNDDFCQVPLLNKCQHQCHIYQNNYKCSCFHGYKQGKRVGIDDHMCFFDENSNDEEPNEEQGRSVYESDSESNDATHRRGGSNYVFRWYKIPQLTDPRFPPNESPPSSSPVSDSKRKFAYDSGKPVKLVPVPAEKKFENDENSIDSEEAARSGDLLADFEQKSLQPDQYIIKKESIIEEGRDSWSDWDASVAKISTQERCNRMCGENRICVLEQGTTDSYRCICDRQGYFSVEDKCLNWCAAAEFRLSIRKLLFKYGCWTQVCRPIDHQNTSHRKTQKEANDEQPSSNDSSMQEEEEEAEGDKLLRLSSWRPQFECDCSSSPFLEQNPNTRLCQLNFRATLEPCLPGNIGYIDCVENKNAYCAVLHRASVHFIRDFIHEKYKDPSKMDEALNNKSKNKQLKLNSEKLYTCVCSPDKKFLVDKPRDKERCVDECDLLNIECVRFNRMCRSASIAPDDFGSNNLVHYDRDGAVKMNFRRTGCECLPGFNVGPDETVDFTLDDEDDQTKVIEQNPNSLPGPKDPEVPDILGSEHLLDQAENMRAKYININTSCLLDYDVVEFHVGFKSPADFDPSWIKIRNESLWSKKVGPKQQQQQQQHGNCESSSLTNSTCESGPGAGESSAETYSYRSYHQSSDETGLYCEPKRGCLLRVPKFMQYNISELHKNIVLVAQCEPALFMRSLSAYQECVRYRYWIIQKLRRHYVDWRRVINRHLSETFDLMDGNIKLRVNKCESTIKSLSITDKSNNAGHHDQAAAQTNTGVVSRMIKSEYLDTMDPGSIISADIDCELTLHSASDGSSPRYSRKVLLEKQLQRFIYTDFSRKEQLGNYYLMAPNLLIRRESFDQLADHRKLFNPCKSDYAYCDMQTDCQMVDTVNFTCTCKFGYTPIGSRDIYYGDSGKDVCEDIDECLFDVCKDLAGVADCENTIGDYKCLCKNQYTGDNKRYCNHVCNTINCNHSHGKCRIVAPHHALCECEDGYKEADCSVQDPNVALRKANMIIVGSIFTSVLLLMITLAISLNSQLKKTKKKLKRLEAISETANLFELHTPQPFRPRMSKAS